VMFGQMHISPAVTQLLARYQKLQVDLLMLDRIVNLVEEGIDIAVRIGELPDSSLIAVPVGEVRRVVCASPGFLESSAAVSKPEHLAQENCIHFTGITTSPSWQFRDKNKIHNVQIEADYVCNLAMPSIEACCAGLGYGMFLSYMVEPQLKSGALQLVLEEFETSPMPVHLVYPQSKYLSNRVRVFVDWMKATLRHELGHQWSASFER
jgi:DNA-binding transcriptional LysR family regulator